MKQVLRLLVVVALAARVLPVNAQSTEIQTEYLMTYSVPLERHPIDSSTVVIDVKPGGWVKGPKLNGKIVPPEAIGRESCHRASSDLTCVF
jgi:hypothetical protein